MRLFSHLKTNQYNLLYSFHFSLGKKRLFERQVDKEREILHFLVHSPKPTMPGLSQAEASNQVLKLCGWQRIEYLSHYLLSPGCSLAGSWIRSRARPFKSETLVWDLSASILIFFAALKKIITNSAAHNMHLLLHSFCRSQSKRVLPGLSAQGLTGLNTEN